MRERAWNLQEQQRPFLLVGCPPCRPFSSLFESNASRMNPEARKIIIREGIIHVNFCVQLYHKQIKNGGYFLHEHPWGAWSWQLPAMKALMECEGVQLGKGHMCRQGMHVKTKEGDLPVLKATGWLTNSPAILQEMAKLCKNDGSSSDHKHASLENGCAAKAAVYPEKLCYSILRGLRKQLVDSNIMIEGEIGTVCEDTEEKEFIHRVERCNGEFYDDISGNALDTKLVFKARMDEKLGVHQHNIFDKVPISECIKNTGKQPISTRWVDINKGDIDKPDYRSRWVGREFKGNDRDREDLFAATPPLEAKKSLIALAASQRGVHKSKFKKLGFIDIRKAYFHAPCKRTMYVQLPEEFCEPGEFGKVCGRLNYSLYGTRDAASNWEECYVGFLKSIGFIQGA